MNVYKEVKIPATTEKRFDYKICDMCGKKSESEYDWQPGSYDINDTKLRVEAYIEKGSDSPYGGGWSEKLSVDLCPDCFKEKLIPWLKSQGVKMTAEDCNW